MSVAASTAFLTALGLSAALAACGPVDRPRERGSHRAPTPTAGGLAVLVAVCAATLFGTRSDPVLAAVLIAGLLGLAGAADDVFDLGAGAKLLAQAAAAVAFASLVGRVESLPFHAFDLPLGPVVGAAGTVLWLLVLTNAVNFMDGSNGLAPGVQAIGFLAFLFVLPAEHPLFALALAGAAASLGFLPWNLAGRLFQGDVGALFSAFLTGALAVLAVEAGHASAWLAPTALAPFLTDVILTVLVRARRRARLSEAHREHLYQLWLHASPRPHLALAWRVWLLTGLCAAAAVAGERAGAPVVAFLAVYALCGTGWIVLRRRIGPSALDARRRSG
jgi:Fuc2NAc and GlcNAc transferase